MRRNSAAAFAAKSPRRAVWHMCCAAAVALTSSGCGDDLDFTYGTRSALHGDSLNGTHVLSDMFASYGHRVATWAWLSPGLREKADVIVWFDSDIEPPSEAVRNWLEEWLDEKPGRTLIYVGRDYDAAQPYLQRLKQGPPAPTPAQAVEINRLLAEAAFDFNAGRGSVVNADGDWFAIDTTAAPFSVRSLKGLPEWTIGVQPGKLGIELSSRMKPGVDVDVLLADGGGTMVVGEIGLDSSRLILIANGSFLLNLPLVNHEHRKLAGRLVESVGDDRYVAFLETDAGDPPILDKDPIPETPHLGNLLVQPPLNTIFFQVVLLGLFFVFVRLPIFGVPKTLARVPLSDFGRHVAALGELLMLTKDRQYAVGRVLQYQQVMGKQHESSSFDRPSETPRMRMPPIG